jgi:MFS family permease
VAVVGVAPAFAFNSLALLGSVATLSLIRSKPRHRSGDDGKHPNVLTHLRQSLEAARRDAPIFLTLIMAAVFCLGYWGATFVGLPALAKLVYNAGDPGVGFLLGAQGIGGLIGGIVVGSVVIRRMGFVGSLLIVGMGVAMALGALSPALWPAAFCFALSGAQISALGTIFGSLVQLRAPDEHRGGIMGLLQLAIFGVTPLGYALAGLLGGILGPQGILLFGAATVFASGILGLWSKEMRKA